MQRDHDPCEPESRGSSTKSTGLKELQGLIWEDGYQSRELKAHVYDDVVPTSKPGKPQQ